MGISHLIVSASTIAGTVALFFGRGMLTRVWQTMSGRRARLETERIRAESRIHEAEIEAKAAERVAMIEADVERARVEDTGRHDIMKLTVDVAERQMGLAKQSAEWAMRMSQELAKCTEERQAREEEVHRWEDKHDAMNVTFQETMTRAAKCEEEHAASKKRIDELERQVGEIRRRTSGEMGAVKP